MMVAVLLVVFWACLLLVAHTYVLYPLLLQVLARGRHQNQNVFAPAAAGLPAVDILLAAHNEEAVIAEKVRSTFATTYPLDRLRLLVGSDNSSDQTNAFLAKLATEYPQLRVETYTERTGKPGVMENLARQATAPILVLTDANVFFAPDTIYHLIKHFQHSAIGLVGGNILNPDHRADGISGQEKAYLERENLIKYQEGVLWGSMMGAFGGCFAVRRACYHPAPAAFLVDDFYITLAVLRDGYQAINELEAVCYEDVSDRLPEEFRRKARISAGNFQNLKAFRAVLWPPWRGGAFALWSHKVLRWYTPLLLLLLLLATAGLVVSGAGWFFQLALAGQLALPLLLLVDGGLRWVGWNSRLLRFVTHFYSMNAALLLGYVRYLRGVKTTIWQPTQRFQQGR
ncbi:glycosyltransferase [Hymenobacter sp. BT683]|uniref:Glycosyltransferase n=1 Tax=Hymenobacter jeongseonensis TaxID=2791027 RepID=A0ABS0IMM4_9BACT|nr:glycosyltransferase [Hymenobacter jeongseonensis]MBF9239612.1 glycosyltransferase [Hymenobacter jeongseonensis]